MTLLRRFEKYRLFGEILAIIGIILLAFLLRANMYVHHDFNFFLDQARDMNLVKQIAVNHKFTLIGARSGLGGIFHGPLWLYMLTPFFLLSNGDPFWTLVPLFLLVSVGIVLAGYFFGRKLYGVLTGLVFALILAINPQLLAANLITTNAQVMPLIFILYLYGIIQFIRGKDFYFIVSILAIGLGFQFESAFSIFLLPLTLVGILFRKTIPNKKILMLSLLVFLVSVSNFIFFDLRHQLLMTHAALGLFQGKVQPIKGYEQYSYLGFRVQDRTQLLQSYFFDSLFQPNAIMSVLIGCLLLTSTTLIFWKKKKPASQKKFKKEYLFILLIPFLYYGIYIFYPMPLWSHYILSLSVTSVFLLTLVIKKLSAYPIGGYVVLIILVLLLYPSFIWIQQTYSHSYSPLIDGSYLNQKAVVDKIFADAGANNFGYFEYSPAILTYNMDYLLWWVNQKHNRTITNTKQPLTYLIMFPPTSKDYGAYAFWKKNVVRTNGKVLSHWLMRGGITIEKLQISPQEPPADPNYYQNLLFR